MSRNENKLIARQNTVKQEVNLMVAMIVESSLRNNICNMQ